MNTIDVNTHVSMSILMSTAIGLETGSLGGQKRSYRVSKRVAGDKNACIRATKMNSCKKNA